MPRLISFYKDYKITLVFLLGMASGIPIALTTSTLNIWLSEAGIDKFSIGLLGMIGIPYTIKFLWAPFIDNLKIPYLSKRIGRRRSWLLVIQIFLIISTIGLGFSNPVNNIGQVALLAFLVAFFSASQDIIIDAYRVEILPEDYQGIAASYSMFGYRCGLYLSGVGVLLLVDKLCYPYSLCDNFSNWKIGYLLISSFILLGIGAAMALGEPPYVAPPLQEIGTKRFLKACFVLPFSNFMQNEKAVITLIFILAYRLCDAFIGGMIYPFFVELGFNLSEIAWIKTFSAVVTVCGAFIGGTLVHKLGVNKALVIGGLLQMLSNYAFVWQAKLGYNLNFLYFTMAMENLGGGAAATCLIAYIAKLCKNSSYTVTQYALLSSFSSAGRIFTSGPAGWVAENYGWEVLFNTSIALGIPPLVLIYFRLIR